MILARVTGTVWSTVQNAHLNGARLLVVRPVDRRERPTGKPLVAVDRVDAGVGDLVLVNKEGGAARLLLRDERSPVQALIVAVVDRVQWQIGGGSE